MMLSDVCLSDCRLHRAYRSRTERSRKTKIGREVDHGTHDSDTTFMVERSKDQKVKGQLAEGGAYCGGLPHTGAAEPRGPGGQLTPHFFRCGVHIWRLTPHFFVVFTCA